MIQETEDALEAGDDEIDAKLPDIHAFWMSRGGSTAILRLPSPRRMTRKGCFVDEKAI